MPIASIIIPCYNHGQYIDEAITASLNQTFDDFEIIIINDGSTDNFTNKKLTSIKNNKIHVIHTENMGLAAARNNGIKAAKGGIIFTLDADDAIEPTFLEKAIAVFSKDPEIGIVYSQAMLFGSKRGVCLLPECDIKKMVVRNYIFSCGLFYRKDWESVGGYKSLMKYGWEDWEFWLSLIEKGKKVFQIKEPLYRYRIRSESMARIMTKDQKIEMHTNILKNHKNFINENIQYLIEEYYQQISYQEKSLVSKVIGKIRHPIKYIKERLLWKKRLL
jgi:glycosyltransferase involved in cell wall biosynthesis